MREILLGINNSQFYRTSKVLNFMWKKNESSLENSKVESNEWEQILQDIKIHSKTTKNKNVVL